MASCHVRLSTMAIEFGCPSCQQMVRVADAAAGKKGKCPRCGTIVQIPGPAAAAPVVAAAPKPKPAKPGSVSFPCPGCGRTMNAPAAMAGKKGKCPHCQTVVVIGGSAPAAAPQSAVDGLQPLGRGDLQPLGSPQPVWSDPLAAPSSGLAPLGRSDDLFASLPPAGQLAPTPLPAASNPLGYTPSPTPVVPSVPAPNPYASYAPSPYGASIPRSYARPTTAPVKLMIPAVALAIISVLSIGYFAFSALSMLITPLPPDFAAQRGLQGDPETAVMAYKIGTFIGAAVGALINFGVIAGAVQMIRLRGWGTAKGAAIAAIVPCSLCCLNIPFGIWALIVLNQPDVRRMFQ